MWLEKAAEKDREARALLKAMRDKGEAADPQSGGPTPRLLQ